MCVKQQYLLHLYIICSIYFCAEVLGIVKFTICTLTKLGAICNKFKKTKNDVNFVRNLGLDDLPSGFGAFKTDKEIDLLTKVEGT